MHVLKDIAPARQWVRQEQRSGRTVGLVPTMGALHRGHLSLVEAARARCSSVAVTIFVNPTQFGPQEDLAAYPRPLQADLAACEKAGVDAVFAPDVETMYPGGVFTRVHVATLTDGLCGPHRPGHFDGVATVVAKLFQILPADAAFFGEKDYQQLRVVQQLVRDLNIPVEVVGCPTVREPDGLAMSSRNAYLVPAQRAQAACLYQALNRACTRAAGGVRRAAELIDGIRGDILAAGPAGIDYVEIVDAVTLEPLTAVNRAARICLAVRIGGCRLIDNVAVDMPAGPI